MIWITFFSLLTLISGAQTGSADSLFRRFTWLYKTGDLIIAEETLFLMLNSNVTPDESNQAAVYNNLGVINIILGKYGKAFEFYNKAESLVTGKKNNLRDLADIYSNKGYINFISKSYDLSIAYYEESIRIYNSLDPRDKSVLSGLSTVYLNFGIALLTKGDYIAALDYLNRSSEIKLKNNFPGIALVYLNVAKVQVKLNDQVQAELYYLKSIDRFIDEFDEDYFRLAEVYFDYGLFLRSAGRDSEALEFHRKALSICLKNYGEKHTLTALSYKHLGDHFFYLSNYEAALEYYQKSLISVVRDFNVTDIHSNPSIDSSIFDIRLLDNLKSKAKALELLGMEQNDRIIKFKLIEKSFETIELALQLITRIRNNYPNEESQIYLSENEKETWLFAIHIAGTLYSLTGERPMLKKMYDIARNAKAAVLRNEITGNELLYSAGIPDSAREKRKSLAGNIAAYNNLILAESVKSNPDSNRISFWKDAIFNMNRDLEKLNAEINRIYPRYNNLLQKTEPVPMSVIQRNLHKGETIADYILSNQYKNGRRDLYIFLVTRDNIEFHQTSLDSGFLKHAEMIRNIDQASVNSKFIGYTGALSYMYEKLVKPVEELFAGNKLIIIPDEEIGWLPFDAFLESSSPAGKTDYEGLQYLIYNYTISYGYSSSMVSGMGNRIRSRKEVFAFSPDYAGRNIANATIDTLQGAAQEIVSIFRWFRGKKFAGDQASETNFMGVISNPAIFHLAMHSVSDTLNSKYSYLLFDTRSDTIEDGRLYNYEISLTRIISPMVVLSACNSGTGTLYYGEGLMSLARGFTLAGASSVIRTAWEVNDETSAKIISRFYYYLAKGRHKDVALREAKLDYMKTSPPAFASPYFWAAYEVLGNNAPVALNFGTLVLIISAGVIIFSFILYLYFRRRRIFTDRSL